MALKNLKDWTSSVTGIADMEGEAVVTLYSEMLATAHDIGYKVPDEQLIETEDADKLRAVIPALHDGIVAHHSAAKVAEKEKAAAEAKKPKPVKKTAAQKPADKPAPTKPAKKAVQKGKQEKTEMATAKTAKKAAPKKAAAKKAPAKKAGKKAAAANARTPAAPRVNTAFHENAVIKVLNKENPARADSERGKRIAVVFKYNGKKASAFFENEKPPMNRTDTLRFLINSGHITVK